MSTKLVEIARRGTPRWPTPGVCQTQAVYLCSDLSYQARTTLLPRP